MNFRIEINERRDLIIARLLWYGTLCAIAFITFGVALGAFYSFVDDLIIAKLGYNLVRIGVTVFIALPVIRVATVLMLFFQARDYVLAAISIFILAIIAIGISFGL